MALPPRKPSGSEYAEHLRAVLARAAEADAATGHASLERAPLLTRAPVIAGLALVFAAVVWWDVRSLTRAPEPLPSPAREVTARTTAVVVAQGLEAYRKEHGTLPATLAEIGIADSALRYTVDGDHYELEGRSGPGELRYRSEEGLASLLKQLDLPAPAVERHP